MNSIYTWGYLAGTTTDLDTYLRVTRALLVDIRMTPRSYKPGWNEWELRARHGARYLHCRALGNVHYKTGGPIQLADPVAGVAALMPHLLDGPVLLLCACRDVRTCHRQEAADALALVTGAPIAHLPGRAAEWRPLAPAELEAVRHLP